LSENLKLVCAGRLVRLLCPQCRKATAIPVSLLAKHGLDLAGRGTVPVFQRGNGCQACQGSGIKKVTGIYEVLPVSAAMKRLLSRWVPDCAFIRQAREDGLASLRETALKMVLDGSVSLEEALSATPEPYHKVSI
jgi:type II secretory ATPase GspE/PulE/Tfp pilus assembly ATPase PilB-like protein